MQALPLYHITHVHLDQLSTQAVPEVRPNGNYLVFWWKSVALGHLFLNPGQAVSEPEYIHLFIAAIRPAVEVYIKTLPANKAQWEQLLLQGRFEDWKDWINTVFVPLAHRVIPETVPVSVVICTRNRAGELKHCLDSIREMACRPAEIVIVDNARENDETEKLVLAYPEAVYVEEPTPGLSYARNTGLQKASNPIIAYTDDDVLVHPDWILNVWETFSDNEVAAMTGLVIASELQTETQLIFEKHWSFNRGFADIFYDSTYFNSTLAEGPPVWQIGAGANMAFRKEVFKEVGFFDERLGAGASGCSEDSEMWYRILKKGHTIHYNPRAIAFHRHRQDLKALHKQLFSYMRGFVVAALIQQNQYQLARYRRHLFLIVPKYYSQLLLRGFPSYSDRFKTLYSEISGMFSGLIFYVKNRRKPAYSKDMSL